MEQFHSYDLAFQCEYLLDGIQSSLQLLYCSHGKCWENMDEKEEMKKREAIREIPEGRKNTEVQEGKGLVLVLRLCNSITPMLLEQTNFLIFLPFTFKYYETGVGKLTFLAVS